MDKSTIHRTVNLFRTKSLVTVDLSPTLLPQVHQNYVQLHVAKGEG